MRILMRMFLVTRECATFVPNGTTTTRTTANYKIIQLATTVFVAEADADDGVLGKCLLMYL